MALQLEILSMVHLASNLDSWMVACAFASVAMQKVMEPQTA
jgi:hypothetical protein